MSDCCTENTVKLNNTQDCCMDNVITLQDCCPVIVQVEGEPYEGSYTIIPMTYDQPLPTTDKVCDKDILVKEIPYSEAENPAGGYTSTIAS